MYLKLLYTIIIKFEIELKNYVNKAKEIFVHKNKSDGKDALISSLKRKVSSLEKEKEMLKEEISVLYSRIYEDI